MVKVYGEEGGSGTNSAFDANDPTYNIGAKNNKRAINSNTGDSGTVGGNSLISNVNKQILAELRAAAKKMGENPIFFEQVFERFNNEFWHAADKDIFQYEALIPERTPGFRDANTGEDTAREFAENPQSYEKLVAYARWWYSSKLPGVSQYWGGAGGDGGGGGGGGGGPSASDIRKGFDIAELANRADDLYRTYLLTEADDPRGLAKTYVESVVKNPDQKLDFDTWVLNNHIKAAPRYASIYKSKPEGMSEGQFLQPYLNMASQVLRPGNADEAAIGAAQFGASSAAFQDRLQRSNEHRTSSSFLRGLEGRMSSIKGVLKG